MGLKILHLCPICYSSDVENTLFIQDWLTEGNKKIYKYHRCGRCGNYYLATRLPIPIINKVYTENYYGKPSKIAKYVKLLIWKNELKIIKKLLPKKAKVLEVGCGRGDYLVFMRENTDYELYGIDVSEDAIKSSVIKNQLYNVQKCSLEELNFPNNSFDLLILRHTFEHLYDPCSSINKIRSLLKKGGVVLFELPQVNNIEYKIFGRYWAGFDAPRHTICFTDIGFIKFLATYGFNVAYVSYSTVPTYWVLSLHHLVKSKNFPSSFVKFFDDKKNFLLMGLFFILNLVFSFFKQTGQIKVIAVKK